MDIPIPQDLDGIVYNSSISFDNNTSFNQTEFNEYRLSTIPLNIFFSIVCVIGLCGNSLVIYVVLRFSKMQTVTNIYILNLAIADEMFLIGIPFLMATMAIGYWPFGEVVCKIYMITTSINQFTSSLFLTVMSADRYIAVCHPINSSKFRTPFISKGVCACTWLISALMMIPVFLYATAIPGSGNSTNEGVNCNIMWPNTSSDGALDGDKAFITYSFLLGFAIPLALIFVFYVLVLRRLKTVGPKTKSKEKKRSHRRVTKMVLTVITVYVACWLPYWVAQVLLAYFGFHSALSVFLYVSGLSYANSAINPILYAFLSDNFKKSFMKAFTCAAGKDLNKQLQIENSMFPRKSTCGSGRIKDKGDSEEDDDHENSTSITLTSRYNTGEKEAMIAKLNNGINKRQPTQL